MSSSDSDDDCYGPVLPPHLMQKKVEETAAVPALEPSRSGVIGPSLPPGLSKGTQQVEEPVDPNPAAITKRPSVYGPVVPDKYNDDDKEETSGGGGDYENDYKNWDDNAGNKEDDQEEDDDDDDDDMIGPFPPGDPRGEALRAARLPSANIGDGEKLKREEWMLVPPKNKPISGLASRKFLPRALDTGKADDDNDDDDDETNEKQDLKEEFQAKLIEKRDELMSNLQSESGTGRSGAESLLESHRKGIKKRKAEEAKQGPVVAERKPFDRETDLKVFKMDADAKNKFINRATSELQGKFSHGKKSGKFL